MPRPKLFTPPQEAYLRGLYLAQSLPPRVCREELNKKYGTNFTPAQIAAKISDSGWSAKKRLIHAKGEVIAEKSITEYAKDHAKQMTEFTAQALKGANKAAGMLETVRDARTLSSIAAAHKSFVTTYRATAGLDSNSPRNGSQVFNYNFVNVAPGASQPKPVEPAESEDDAVEV